jgi:hypothetical protein
MHYSLKFQLTELGCSQMVKQLPSMHEALGLIPAPKKKEDKKDVKFQLTICL